MRSVPKMLLSSLIAGALFVPAAHAANGDCRQIRGAETPDDPADDVSVCRQDTWIHQATTKVGNVAGVGGDTAPSWNTTAPTASATAGGGAVYATNSTFHQVVAPQDPRGSAVFRGTYTGTLDTLAVDLYAFVGTGAFTGDLNITLTIDGESVFASNAVASMAAAPNQAQRLRFAFTNLYGYLDSIGAEGTSETVHTLTLGVNGRYVVNDSAVFVYDSAEYPSGLSFNLEPTGLASYTQIDVFPEG